MSTNDNAKVQRKRYIAYHEAGHAVAADRHGVAFSVVIDGQPRVELAPLDPDIACCITYAGPLAQARYQKRCLTTVLLTHGSADADFLDQQSVQWRLMGWENRKLEQWRLAASEILRERWTAVEAVSARLLALGRMTSDEVREIVAQLGYLPDNPTLR